MKSARLLCLFPLLGLALAACSHSPQSATPAAGTPVHRTVKDHSGHQIRHEDSHEVSELPASNKRDSLLVRAVLVREVIGSIRDTPIFVEDDIWNDFFAPGCEFRTGLDPHVIVKKSADVEISDQGVSDKTTHAKGVAIRVAVESINGSECIARGGHYRTPMASDSYRYLLHKNAAGRWEITSKTLEYIS
jgi:hypothetical protein